MKIKKHESTAAMIRRSKKYLAKAKSHITNAERLIEEGFEILAGKHT